MLNPTQWRLRGARLYGINGTRSPLILCRDLKFPLVRVDANFNGFKPTARAGTIQQSVAGIKSGEQTVAGESRYYVFPSELGRYSLLWNPIASLPQGHLQIWEYIGDLSDSFLNQL